MPFFQDCEKIDMKNNKPFSENYYYVYEMSVCIPCLSRFYARSASNVNGSSRSALTESIRIAVKISPGILGMDAKREKVSNDGREKGKRVSRNFTLLIPK